MHHASDAPFVQRQEQQVKHLSLLAQSTPQLKLLSELLGVQHHHLRLC